MSDQPRPILIIDDEEEITRSVSSLLSSRGIGPVETCNDSRMAMEMVEQYRPEVVLLDLTMPHLSGDEILEQIVKEWPETAVIVLTASTDIRTAVECMKTGASDYMVKAVEESRLISGVRRQLEIRKLRSQYHDLRNHLLSDTIRNPAAFARILTRDRRMHSIFLFIESVASTKEPILVTGETGVGKNLIAEAIHTASGRTGSLVSVNIAGLDDEMFSDTLFGHTKGAFTGAAEMREGLIHRAAGGSVILDEIADLSPISQIKLLRLLDNGDYYPVGSDLAKRTDARMIFATNRDLSELSKKDKFRSDLYYRLSTYSLEVPPLRDRPGDFPILVEYFLTSAAEDLGKQIPRIPPEFYVLLENYEFPGNIRELHSLVYEMMARNESGTLSLNFVRNKLGLDRRPVSTGVEQTQPEVDIQVTFGDRLPTIKESTDSLITEALRRSKGNQSIAAGMLGISHQALNKRLKRRQES